jgi:poly(A) polymerase
LEPAKTIKLQPWMTDADTRAVMGALAAPDLEGPAALFVGGCVRDTLIGRDVVDIDIATAHPPDEVVRRLEAAGIGYHTIGIDHGTVAARGEGRLLEITTLRVDVETHGRHATVAYTDDWAVDAARRDFTINALYMDMDGRVFDPLGGMADVDARRVRFIGDASERIHEDALRILRFYRFHAQLDLRDLDPKGLAACQENAALLDNLSGERIRNELFKMLLSPGANWMLEGEAFPELFDWLFPELPNLRGSHGLFAVSYNEMNCGNTDALRRLVSLIEAFPFRDVSDLPQWKADAERIAARLRLSGQQARRLITMLERPRDLKPRWPVEKRPTLDHASVLLPVPFRLSLLGRLRREKKVDRSYLPELYRLEDQAWCDAVMLNWSDQDARIDDAARTNALARFHFPQDWQDLLDLPKRLPRPVFPLQGKDVLDLGVPQGPEISRSLGEVEKWWIDGGFVADRKACLAELKHRAVMAR